MVNFAVDFVWCLGVATIVLVKFASTFVVFFFNLLIFLSFWYVSIFFGNYSIHAVVMVFLTDYETSRA